MLGSWKWLSQKWFFAKQKGSISVCVRSMSNAAFAHTHKRKGVERERRERLENSREPHSGIVTLTHQMTRQKEPTHYTPFIHTHTHAHIWCSHQPQAPPKVLLIDRKDRAGFFFHQSHKFDKNFHVFLFINLPIWKNYSRPDRKFSKSSATVALAKSCLIFPKW